MVRNTLFTIRQFILTFFFLLLFVPQCFAANVTIVPNQSLTQLQLDAIADGVQRITRYMASSFNLQLQHDVTINVASDDKAESVIGYAELQNKVGGNARVGEINLVVNPSSSWYYLAFLTAHEMTHQYQMDRYGSTDSMNKNLWFVEGMADYIGARAVHPVDMTRYSSFRSSAISKTMQADFTLEQITSHNDWNTMFLSGKHVYGKADMALIYINNHFAPELMWTYFDYLYTYDANTALKKVYGLSLSDLDILISHGMT